MRAPLHHRRERPLLFTLATGALATSIAGLMLWWAYETPEAVVIGMPGRHDARSNADRLADCLDCHVPFVGTPGTRCLGPGCHGALATGTPPRDGPAMPIRFHVALREYDCSTCHVEHASKRERRTGKNFTHDVLPRKERSRCARCHLADRRAHARTDAVSCDLCHGFERWEDAKIEHKQVKNHPCDLCHALPPTDAHVSVVGACNDCHNPASWAPQPAAK